MEKVKQVNFHEFKYQWMTRMAVGISTILFIGIVFDIERFMWAGFACGSLLSVYSTSPKIKERLLDRFIGVTVGAVIFFVIYNLIPSELHVIIGPLGGFCLGFCVEYKYKTVMNCLGALLIASEIYGLQQSIFLRISDTVIGLVFALCFLYVYDRYIVKILKINKHLA